MFKYQDVERSRSGAETRVAATLRAMPQAAVRRPWHPLWFVRVFHARSGAVQYAPMVDASPPPNATSPQTPPSTAAASSTTTSTSHHASSSLGAESRLSRLLRETTGRSESGLLQRLRPHTMTVLMACVAWALAVRNLRDKTRWQERHELQQHDLLVLQNQLAEAAVLHTQLHATLTGLPPSTPLRQRALDQSALLAQHLHLTTDTHHTSSSSTPGSPPAPPSTAEVPTAPKTTHTTLFSLL